MRALVVASMASAYPEFVADLANRADLVIAADGGGMACLSAGVAPDLVVGDLDSLSADAEQRLRAAGVAFVTVPAEKDVTDLDLALDESASAGADEVWVTGALGGRLDHTLASLGSLCRRAGQRPHVVEPDCRAWVMAPDGRSQLRLGGVGALVSLFALGTAATVSTSGLKYPLTRESLAPLDSRGLSNVITAEGATIEVAEGVLLVLCHSDERHASRTRAAVRLQRGVTSVTVR